MGWGLLAACTLLIGVFLNAAASGQQPSAPQAEPVTAAQVTAHLQATIDWYQAVSAALQQPRGNGGAATADELHHAAIEALQLAFDYAREQAALLQTAAPGAANNQPSVSSSGNLSQIGTRLTDRVSSLQAELEQVNASLATARGSSRTALVARRDAISADLQVAQTMRDSIQQVLKFASTTQAGASANDTLASRINALERSVPEARHTAPATLTTAPAGTSAAASHPAPASAPATPVFDPQGAGIVSLATELFAIAGTRRTLSGVMRTTDGLLESIQQRRTPLAAEVRTLIRGVDAASSGNDSMPAPTTSQRTVGQVQRVTAALVPLAEQGVAVENTRTLLAEWRNSLAERAGTVGWYLMMRVVVLVVAVVALLLVSELWRRATFRYLHDLHRRRQFLLLRRIVVAAVMVVIVVFGFVSEIGSIATYAGFVTAGLAVALQNVILAVVAYFLLIGRYGIHAGDRVTIGGVTGRVIEIGLVRLYMMELAGPDLHPTGRIVVYSNAIIFQPSALFRQVPGVDYAWHTVTLTLGSNADLGKAEQVIRSAVDAAFEPFRESIERQYARLRQTADVDTAPPKPEVRVRVAEPGIEVVVRFPVDQARANDLDNAIMTAVRHAVAQAPGIELAPAGAPTLQVNTPT